jgi:plastocyanin
MDKTLFYVLGIALVVSAFGVAFVGLRFTSFPPTRLAVAALAAYFAALVAATTTFAVLNARDEQNHREAEEAAATQPGGGEETGAATTTTTTTGAAKGGGETLKISSPADGSTLFEPDKLTAKAGPVTIDYDNPSPVDHSIAIESHGQTLDESDTAANTTLTASADLKPGKYTYFCTVPGHRESGMEGTLTVK